MTTINSQEDFLRALEENPQWKAAVRALILGEELLALPARFNALVDQVTAFVDQMTSFVADQKQFNQRMEGFVDEQKQINKEMQGFVAEQKQFNKEMQGFVAEQKQFNKEMQGFVVEQRQFNKEMQGFVVEQRQFNQGFTRRLDRIEGDIGRFRGAYAESAAVRNTVAITAELGLEYVRSVPQEDLARMSRSAVGRVPINQLRSFWTADLIIEARNGDDIQYIAVESSYTADQRDTDRLHRNVEFLREFTGQSARAVVVSVRNDDHVRAQVESGAVYWFQLEDHNPRPE